MTMLRQVLIVVLWAGLAGSYVSAAPSKAMGTVVLAKHAQVSNTVTSAGATLFGGERLSTEAKGALQVRTGTARFYLAAWSTATLAANTDIPSLTLTAGTLVFSTATAQGFELRAANAQIRAQGDVPTMAQVSIAGPKELIVSSRRGALAFTVGDETEIIPEGSSYRVVLDPEASQGPRGAGADKVQAAPRQAGKSKRRFLFIMLGTTAFATGFALHEVFESPNRP